MLGCIRFCKFRKCNKSIHRVMRKFEYTNSKSISSCIDRMECLFNQLDIFNTAVDAIENSPVSRSLCQPDRPHHVLRIIFVECIHFGDCPKRSQRSAGMINLIPKNNINLNRRLYHFFFFSDPLLFDAWIFSAFGTQL